MAGLVYLFVFLYSYPEWGLGHIIRAADYRPLSMLIYATFWWWFAGSPLSFLLVIAFGTADRSARATVEQAAVLVDSREFSFRKILRGNLSGYFAFFGAAAVISRRPFQTARYIMCQ
jgi:hypothetical protein